jgi:hypothetical protein
MKRNNCEREISQDKFRPFPPDNVVYSYISARIEKWRNAASRHLRKEGTGILPIRLFGTNNLKEGAMLHVPIARQQVINKSPPPKAGGNYLGKGATVHQGIFCWLANRNSTKLSNSREGVAKRFSRVEAGQNIFAVSRKRRRKGNPVPVEISGPPCSWGI